MATILFANNAATVLAGPISNTALTAVLATGTGVLFPSPAAGQYFAMTFTDAATGLLNEIVYVTARSGDMVTFIRAQEGTAARSWLSGDYAANLVTAGTMAALETGGSAAPYVYNNPTISSAYSWSTTVPTGCTRAKVVLVAAGGGGAGGTVAQAGAGAGSGAAGIFWLSGLSAGDSMWGAMGAGGLGGIAGATGATGGASTLSWNSTLIATLLGGVGGIWSVSAPAGGAGGAISLGSVPGPYLALQGSCGGDAEPGGTLYGGNGAPGYLGAGAGRAGSNIGVAATSAGAGGGGSYGGMAGPGGNGAAGLVIVEFAA
jgi:hypothetical protein